MQIICKKKLQFNDYEIVNNEKTGEKVAQLHHSFIAGPSLRTIEAPDWIVNDDLFALAMADGSVIVVGEIPSKQSRPWLTTELTQPAQPVHEPDAAELALLNTPLVELTGGIVQPASYPRTSKGWPSLESL